MKWNYTIGHYYRYPEPKNTAKYKLIAVTDWVARFECGHWVTDSVFMDLIDCKTGVQVYKDCQLRLFN